MAESFHRVHTPTLRQNRTGDPAKPSVPNARPDVSRGDGGAIPCRTVADTAPLSAIADVELVPLTGEPRPFNDFLTMFPLVLGVIDPFTYESSWALDSFVRIFRHYSAANCRTAFLATADVAGTEQFLGPITDEFMGFADPDRTVVKALELEVLPALVVVRQDGSLMGSAGGWDPEAWRAITEDLSDTMHWSRPTIPGPGDPVAYPGTPAIP